MADGWQSTVLAVLPAPGPYPQLAKFKNLALFSDNHAGEGRLKVGHRNAIQVLYNNGAAKYLDIGSRFDFGGGFNQSIGN